LRRSRLAVGIALLLVVSFFSSLVLRHFGELQPFSIHCDDLYLAARCLQGTFQTAPFCEPDSQSLLLVDAFPREPGGEGRQSYGALLAMFHRPGEHELEVAEKGDYWLLYLDGALYGAVVFSADGMVGLANDATQITSLSLCYDDSPPDWDCIREMESLRFVLGGGTFSDERSLWLLESGVIYSDLGSAESLYGAKIPGRFLYHMAVNSPKPADRLWKAVVNEIRPVSLELTFSISSDGLRLRCSPSEKEEMLKILGEIPDSVRYLSASVESFWGAQHEIADVLSEKPNIRVLSLSFVEGMPAEDSTLAIACNSLRSLSLTFEEPRLAESSPLDTRPAHPTIFLSGDTGSLRVLRVDGGKLDLRSPALSAVRAFQGSDTLFAGDAVSAGAGFSPAVVDVLPGSDWSGPAFEGTVGRYARLLASATEVLYSEEMVALTGIATLPSARRVGLFLADKQLSAPVALAPLVRRFPNLDELILFLYVTGRDQTVLLDAAGLPASKLQVAAFGYGGDMRVEVVSRPPKLHAVIVTPRVGGRFEAQVPARVFE